MDQLSVNLSHASSETDSSEIKTPTMVQTPSIQSTTLSSSHLTIQSQESTDQTPSISIKTPSLVESTMNVSASEQISTPATIEQAGGPSELSSHASLSILSFRRHDLRAPQADDILQIARESVTSLQSDSSMQSFEKGSTTLFALHQEPVSVDTIIEEDTRSTQSLVSFRGVLEEQTCSTKYSAEVQTPATLYSSEEEVRLTAQVESLKAELDDLRTKVDNKPAILHASTQCDPPVDTIETVVQTENNSETVIELDREEYNGFMVIAMKYQEENGLLWEQIRTREETISLLTAANNSLSNEVTQLGGQINMIMDENVELRTSLQEYADKLRGPETTYASQQTDSIEQVSQAVHAMIDVPVPLSVDSAQQTSSPMEVHNVPRPYDLVDEYCQVNQEDDQEQVLLKAKEVIAQRTEELKTLIEKISALGSWYSNETRRLESIQYVQSEADSLLQRSQEEGKQSDFLRIGGSVLPAPSHDGEREQRTISSLINALNFQPYQESTQPGDNLPASVLAYTADVLPKIIDIQRMLRAVQKEYYAYREQLKDDGKVIAAFKSKAAALEDKNKQLEESISALRQQLDRKELTKADLATGKANSLLDQLIPFINDEITKKKAINMAELEKTIVEHAQSGTTFPLQVDITDVADEFSLSIDVSITEDTVDELRKMLGWDTSQLSCYEPLISAANTKQKFRDQSRTLTLHDYKLHYLRAKLDSFVLRQQFLTVLQAMQQLINLDHTSHTHSPDSIMPFLNEFKAILALKEKLQEENQGLSGLIDQRNKRIHELELILLALYQQSTYFFRSYKSILDMAVLSLQKQDSLIMYSDIGAINMIVLQAKMSLSHSENVNVKTAALKDLDPQSSDPVYELPSSKMLPDIQRGSTLLNHKLKESEPPRLPSRGDLHSSLLLSNCDAVASQVHENHSQTPLMIAVIEGDYKSITPALIHKCARQQDDAGMTALMHAAVHRRFGLISKLAPVEAGMTLPDGRTALYLAIELKYMDIAEELRAYEGTPVLRIPESLRHAKSSGSRRSSQHKKDMFGSITGVSTSVTVPGITNLMAAAEKNDLVTVWVLIPNEGCIQDSKGRTALMYAAYSGNLRVAELLVQFEARMQDVNGCTALMYAVQAKHVELVKLLANSEARIINNMFSTALMMATRLKNEQMVTILAALECGIQGYSSSTARLLPMPSPSIRKGPVNPKDFFTADANGSGVTALMIAASVGFKYGVSLLLKEECGLVDRNGYSAYDYAAYSKGDEKIQKEIVYLLRTQGGSPRHSRVLHL